MLRLQILVIFEIVPHEENLGQIAIKMSDFVHHLVQEVKEVRKYR